MNASDTVRDALFEASQQADIDDVLLNIYLHRHKEWLSLNPEYTQSPYTTLIAELQGQLPLFNSELDKHMKE